jgi:hypothetical protein
MVTAVTRFDLQKASRVARNPLWINEFRAAGESATDPSALDVPRSARQDRGHPSTDGRDTASTALVEEA